MLELQLLGPVRLLRDGRPLGLSIRKTRVLLALLALQGALSRARVVDLLWPGLDEPTARRNLRRELARLRELGAGDAVQAEGDLLRLGPTLRVAAPGFATPMPQADAAAVLHSTSEAPLGELDLDDAPAFSQWLHAQREQWRGRWRDLLARAADAAERDGDPLAALALVDRLLAEDPLQEQSQRRAMALLAAAGRPEEALARYRRLRELLRVELDLAPMPQTEALAATLSGVPADAAVSAYAPPQAPPATARALQQPPLPLAPLATFGLRSATRATLPTLLPLVGREAEVALLEHAWRSGQTILIEGEGGVGKSRLAQDFAAAHGAYALVRCHAADAERPLASIARGLRVLAGPEPTASGLPPWVAAELARLLPELGPAPPPLRSAAERTRLGDAVALAWQHWAVGNFDAIVLDDWHLADAASQALLPQVIAWRTKGAEVANLRELLVYRPELAPDAAARLHRLRDGGATHVALTPLPPSAVLELVRHLSGSAAPQRFAQRLSDATAGHPFHLLETLHHLVDTDLLKADEHGHWHTPFDEATEDYRELPLPPSVRAAVLGRVQRLSEPARRMLDAAALAGEPFEVALLAPACALSEVEGALALEQAQAAHLLRERTAGGWGFVHDLVPQALTSAMGPERSRAVHRRLALGAAAMGADPARVAAHHEAGGEPLRAVAWRCRAAESALRLMALEEAIRHWRQARADGGSALAADDALVIAQSLCRVSELAGDMESLRAEYALLQVLLDRGTGSAEARIEATLVVASVLANDDEVGAAAARLDSLPPVIAPRQRAMALRVRSEILRNQGRIDDSYDAARQALGEAELPVEERARLLDGLTRTAMVAGRLRESLEHLEAAAALSRSIGDGVGLLRAAVTRGVILVQVGDPPEAEAALRAAAAEAGRCGMFGQQRSVLFNLCVLYADLSQPRRVLEVARESWNLPARLGREPTRVMLRLAFVEAHSALGELGAAWHWLTGALDDVLTIDEVAIRGAVVNTGFELLALLGESARAAPLLAALEGQREARHYVHEMRLVQAECALQLGDAPRAKGLLQSVGPPGEEQRVALRQRIVEAALTLAEGDAPGALAALPLADAPGSNAELRWRALAVRVGGEAATGGLSDATRAEAERALATDDVHAVAQWWLHRSLKRADPTARRLAAFAAHRDHLAQTLAEHPAQRAAFEQAWA